MAHAAAVSRREPLAAKVPEVTFLFWVIKLLTTAGGEAVSDFLVPHGYLLTGVVEVVFSLWYRSERTLSIHSIVTRRRELFYWAVVFATFALGTAVGDFTARVLNLGYLGAAVLFTVVIMVPAVAWSQLKLNSVLCFWAAYVVTRPLGASFADYFGKPKALTGLDYGDGPVSLG